MRLCAICAGLGKSCCEQRDVLLSDGDVERISVHAGRLDFFESRPACSTAYLDQDDDPLWNVYTLDEGGRRRVLKHRTPGRCWFLGPQGCRLPVERRPLVCRLHPFEYTEERLTGLSPECPAGFLAAGETLLANLEMNPGEAEEWRRQLYEELRRNPASRSRAA